LVDKGLERRLKPSEAGEQLISNVGKGFRVDISTRVEVARNPHHALIGVHDPFECAPESRLDLCLVLSQFL
jgi:hypothetical protein